MEGDAERVEAALDWLRGARADARFSALDSATRPAPVPEALGLPTSTPPDPTAPTGLAAIHASDRATVVRAYERARSVRVSVASARLLTGEHVQVHFVDLRESHGVMLIGAVPADASGPTPVAEEEVFNPRVTWSRLDAKGTVLEVDAAGVKMFGWSTSEVVGQPALPKLHPDDHDRVIGNWIDVLLAPGEARRCRVRHLRSDGSYVWVDVTHHNRLEDPAHADVLAEMVDVTDEMAIHESLRERERLLRELADALPIGVLQFDAARATVHENERMGSMVGPGGLLGLSAALGDADRVRLETSIGAVLAGQTPEPHEVVLPGDRVGRITLRPLREGGGIACLDDVTEAAHLRRELELRATFDFLTSCFSRSAILGALQHVAAEGPGTGVVFVDLDRFKPVNDELGHAAGDELLVEVGERLRAAVRDVDLVGRVGGDEFLVVCPGLADEAAVHAIAAQVAHALARPLSLHDDHVVLPRASMGVAWAPAGTDTTALVARADAAMYDSKRQSRIKTA